MSSYDLDGCDVYILFSISGRHFGSPVEFAALFSYIEFPLYLGRDRQFAGPFGL